MLEMQNQKAKLTNLNVRGEKHGNDTVTASDISFAIEAPNTLLDTLEPGMLEAFYILDANPQQKPLLPDVGKTKLRFPKLGPLSLDRELVGWTVQIPHGVGEPLTLEGVTVNRFALELKEGGTVVLGVRVQFHPAEGELDILASKIQQAVELTLIAPAPQPELATAA